MRINQNLEAMAKQLYDYWFVQFDFPDANGRPYKSSGGKMVWNDVLQKCIPHEWHIISLSDILSNERPKQIDPSLHPNSLFKHLSFPSFDKCGSYELEYGSEIHSNKIVIEKGYVLAAKLNPWIKRIVWGTDEENLICSTEFVVLKPQNIELKAFIYEMVNHKSFIDYCTSSTSGTSHSQRRVKPEIMKKYQFPFNEEICTTFCKIIKPIIEQKIANVKEIQSLQEQRNELLPLLMNGQVSIRQLNSDLSDD